MAIGALLSVIAALYTADVEPGVFPKPLIVLLAVSGAVVLFNIEPERLFLSWLLVAPLIQGLQPTSWSNGLTNAAYLAPAVILTVHTIAKRGRRLPVAWFDFLPAAYVLLVAGSLAVTTSLLRVNPVGSLNAVFQTVALGPVLYYFLAFRARTWLTSAMVVRVLLVSCALQGAMSIVEYLTKWNLWGDVKWHLDSPSRSVATLQNPAVLGGFIGVGVALALAVLAWEGPREFRRVSIAVLVVGLPGIVFTFTRGPMVAVAVIGLLVVLLRGRTRFAAGAVIFAAVLALVIAWPSLSHTSVYRERLSNSKNVQSRVVLQDLSIRLWKEKPVLGWGYDSFDRVKSRTNFGSGSVPIAVARQDTSHDTYLTVLVEYGFVGFLLLLVPFVVIMLRAARAARALSPDRWLLIGAPAAILVMVLTATTIDYRFFTFAPAIPWLLLGLARRLIRSPGTVE
jgi:O-antigen ligase